MTRPFGEVVVLSRANKLVLTDTAGNLTRIVALLRDLDGDQPGSRDSQSYRCRHIDAINAVTALNEYFGRPSGPARPPPSRRTARRPSPRATTELSGFGT